MDDSVIRIALLLIIFAGMSSALQVTPNSPCSKICLNDAGVSSISSSDISCSDDDYSKPLGKKFQKCVECLQTSSFGTDDGNDQAWLLYNLRFAADWCMFAPDNSQRISGPCMDSVTCGGLEASLDVSNGDPKNSTTFNYCEKNSGRFPSEAAVCNDCVQHMPQNKYLSNWIVALEAGCSQRPSQKALLGLTGSFFSDEAVIISTPLSPDDPKLKSKNEHEGLPMQAIIGIIVGAVVITLMTIGVVGWKCWKKCKARKLAEINSQCHSRFGAVDIPAPLDGAYSEYKPEPVVEVAPWDEDYMMKKMSADSRTSDDTKQSSVSSDDSSWRLNPQKDQTRTNSKPAPASQGEPSRQASRPAQEPVMQQARPEPASQPRAVSPEPDRNPTQINPLRMNSFQQHCASIASVGVAVTAPGPVNMPTPSQLLPPIFTPTPTRNIPTPPQPIPTPPPTQPQSRAARSKPSPLNLNCGTTYVSGDHLQPSARPSYALSMISSTSTTFSPGVYHSPPPQYQSPVRSTFNQPIQLRPNQRLVAPLPTYNPADYAPKPTNPYHKSQLQLKTQQRSYSPVPAQQPTRAFHRPQPSVASSSSRFSFAASTHTTSQPPQPRPKPQPKQSVPKQKDSPVPIIALPIPAPKRQTVDLRNLVGMNLKQHISPENDDVPAMPSKSPEIELPIGLDRTESLLAKSSPPFRSLARNLNPEAAMTLPPTEKSPPLGLDEGTIQVQRPDCRASYRGRSASRPRRESLPRTQGTRETSGSRVRYRSRSRDVDLEGGDGRKKKAFSFGIRGQDAWSVVDSPESGNKSTDVEQWPGKM